MTTATLRLRDDLFLDLRHEDRTPFGSALSGMADQLVKKTCRPLFERFRRLASDEARARAASLLARCFDNHALGGLYERPGRLHGCCVYPDPGSVLPAALRIWVGGENVGSVRVPRAVSRNLAGWLSAWSAPSLPPRGADVRVLWDSLAESGALTPEPPLDVALDEGVTFIGHASVAFRSGDTRLLFDPFFPPEHGVDDYRPFRPAELRPTAVFVTHSHPDHFSLSSLLRLGADTPMYVPNVPRECLLSVDMAARLTELGFTRVNTISWGERVPIGPYVVTAHPFWGEQPTDREVFHPELRNLGNTYVVDDGAQRVALLADAGRDRGGSVLEQARDIALEGVRVNTVFGGYRAARIHPAQYLDSAVARFLLFVPPEEWSRRFRSMNDANDLIATARAFGARFVVPYANGGAPWHWDNGYGPRLDRQRDGHDPEFLPFGLSRDEASDLPEVVHMHPGERLREECGEARLSARAEHTWPFGRASA